MKKKLAKFINDLSKKMPVVYEEVYTVEYKTGTELIEKGVTHIYGKEVVLKERYKLITPRLQEVDHYRRLKRFYVRHKRGFVKAYMESLRLQQLPIISKYPKAFQATA